METYTDVDNSVVDVFTKVIYKKFPTYSNLNIKYVFCNKKRTKNNNIVISSTEVTNVKTKFLTSTNNVPNGYDYIIFLDKKAWELASDKDKERIASHELRHIFIDEKGNTKIISHDVEDFKAEIESNIDDPLWRENLTFLVNTSYEQETDDKKSKQ